MKLSDVDNGSLYGKLHGINTLIFFPHIYTPWKMVLDWTQIISGANPHNYTFNGAIVEWFLGVVSCGSSSNMIVATAVIKSGGVLWCGHCALASIKMHPTHLFLLYDCICCTSGHGSSAAPLCYITISLCECDERCTEPNLDTWWS